jgi:Amt family ammonium transporter
MLVLAAVSLLLAPGSLPAQEVEVDVVEEAVLVAGPGNIHWRLLAAMLAMFMQAGLALLACGLVRAKNAADTVMKNFVSFAVAIGVFFAVGHGLMFGASVAGFTGTGPFFLEGIDAASPQGQWALANWCFQALLAAAAAAIVSGGLAERMTFAGYMAATLLMSAVIYPVSGHWAWGGLLGGAGAGWLGGMGFLDAAGSTVVHSVAGWVAFAGAIVLGPRLGKYTADGKAKAILGHNLPMAALGVLILWFAWFGVTCGSPFVPESAVGHVAVNTQVAACFGFLGAMTAIWLKTSTFDPSLSFSGALAGLVAISAGCLEVSPVGALVIGLFAGGLVVVSVLFIDQVLRVDDPVGVISIHGVCGLYGTIMVGLFAAPGYGEHVGLLYGGTSELLLTQAVGVMAVFAWAFGAGYCVFWAANRFLRMRHQPRQETEGLDKTEHGAEAYCGFQIFDND